MNKIIRLLIATIILIPAQISWIYAQNSTDTIKLTLEQAQAYALENSANVKNALIDLESTRKKIWENTATGLPQVNAAANYQNLFNVPSISFGSYMDYNSLPNAVPITRDDLLSINHPMPPISLAAKENITGTISVSQLIFSDEYFVGLQALKIVKQLSEQALTKTQIDTKETIAKSYYNLLIIQQIIRIYRQDLNVITQTLNDKNAMYKKGFAESTEVDQIQLNKVNLENKLIFQEWLSQVASRMLNFQIGIDLAQPVFLTDSIGKFVVNMNLDIFQNASFYAQNNIDYKIMATQEGLSYTGLKREKAKYFPIINAVYQHQELLNKPTLNFSFPNVLAVSLSWPLFSSGMRNSRVQQAKLALDKSTIGKNQVEKSLQITFEQNRNAYKNALNTYFNIKKTVELSRSIYNNNLIKFRAGMASSSDLTRAEDQYLNTQISYYMAIQDFLTTKLTLEKLLESAK